ncbi:hypothetical protein EB796_001158 [Bugula neritina]|uniref:Uncharacterized protein n=1 Tax=Bugula neritina TaxID=10212 RepID=A0A7J7KR33_BUGNE|nr:hypothetical protein EB796_001158 [Bugula neritina]
MPFAYLLYIYFNLTDQVEDTQQHYEREKTRPEVEKSPRDRIQELEDELVTACAQLDQLKQEQKNIFHNAQENKCLVNEQAQVIHPRF